MGKNRKEGRGTIIHFSKVPNILWGERVKIEISLFFSIVSLYPTAEKVHFLIPKNALKFFFC